MFHSTIFTVLAVGPESETHEARRRRQHLAALRVGRSTTTGPAIRLPAWRRIASWLDVAQALGRRDRRPTQELDCCAA